MIRSIKVLPKNTMRDTPAMKMIESMNSLVPVISERSFPAADDTTDSTRIRMAM